MIIKRNILHQLKEHLSKREITILVGPRQIGKTTLMEKLYEDCIASKKRTLWLNLDVEVDFQLLSTQETLLQKIDLLFDNTGGVIFIDEIQRKENAGLFIKGIYDTNKKIKFVLSGSGSMELKERIIESLAGRKRVFEIPPISFDEFIDYKTDYKYSDRLSKFKSVDLSKVSNLFNEYVLYGGYPRVVLEKTATNKRIVLSEILNSYLSRDIKQLLNIHNYSSYSKLYKIISQQIGRPIQYTSMSQYTTVTAPVVKEYIWYLRHTYMISESIPYFTNPLKELVKEPVLYYFDLGMLNYQRNNLIGEIGLPSFGFIFQNFVYNELKIILSDYYPLLKHWRTKNKAEVDIIIEMGSQVFPVEIKHSTFKKLKIERSFRSFINKYSPSKAFVICKSGSFTQDLGQTKIYFIPFNELNKIGEILMDS